MAHFAELDDNNVVLRVIVVSNKDTADANGVEDESIGIAFCRRLLGGRWIQTSYNNKFRKNYAGIGCTYDPVRDAFIPAKPEGDWVLNEETCRWEPTVPMPKDGKHYVWNDFKNIWVEEAAP